MVFGGIFGATITADVIQMAMVPILWSLLTAFTKILLLFETFRTWICHKGMVEGLSAVHSRAETIAGSICFSVSCYWRFIGGTWFKAETNEGSKESCGTWETVMVFKMEDY